MSKEDKVAARINFGGSTHAPVVVSVLDPEKVVDGSVSSHIAFTIRCSTSSSFGEWKEGTSSVKRRYRDFVWLDGTLGDTFPGAIRPPLPPSSLVGVDVAQRRHLLELYLKRVLRHPELSFARSVYAFCCAPDDGHSSGDLVSFAEFMTAQRAESTATSSSAVSSGVGFDSPMPSGADLDAMMMGMLAKQTPLDAKFEAEAEHVKKLGATLEAVVKHAEQAAQKHRHLAQQLFAAGLSYSRLAKEEASQQQHNPAHSLGDNASNHGGEGLGVAGNCSTSTTSTTATTATTATTLSGGSSGSASSSEGLRTMGCACDELSQAVAKASEEDAQTLLAPLQEHAALLSAVGAVLAQRTGMRQQAREAAEAWVARADTARQRRKRAVDVEGGGGGASSAAPNLQQEDSAHAGGGPAPGPGANSAAATASGAQQLGSQAAALAGAGPGASHSGEGSSYLDGSISGHNGQGHGHHAAAALRAEQAEALAAKAAVAALEARKKLALTDERLCRELDRFKREKASEVRAAVLAFCRHRARHAHAQEALWKAVQPVMEAAHLALDPHSARLVAAEALNAAASSSSSSSSVARAPSASSSLTFSSSPAGNEGRRKVPESGSIEGSLPGSGSLGGRPPAISEDWNEASV